MLFSQIMFQLLINIHFLYLKMIQKQIFNYLMALHVNITIEYKYYKPKLID
jgi:hypothetical protein